jgi:flagellar hook-basal body complex protein FliE
MTINPADVAQAYSSVSKSAGLGAGPGGGLSGSKETGGSAFADILKNSIDSVAETGRASEKMSIQAMSGDAELVDVVTAISAAEVTLETVVAVRDKVIGAYNEIMRMPI